jgi:CheY-like chemotaxis protein
MAFAITKMSSIPNPNYAPGSQEPPTVYDLWPICYDRDHPPSNPDPTTGYDTTAAGLGAKPGLRLSAFIDEFGANGRKFSTCESDWSSAMSGIERPNDHMLRHNCIDGKIADANRAACARSLGFGTALGHAPGMNGYHVLMAHSPGQAMQLSRAHQGEIHLLMSDVVMPEMNGRELAKNVLALCPGIKRLFMSGYTADIIAHQGVLEAGVAFNQKPFSLDAIIAKVREVLDGGPSE